MRQLLQAMTYFNWLVLPMAIFNAIRYGDGHNPITGIGAVFIPNTEVSRAFKVLKRKKVRYWGLAYLGNEATFQVPRQQWGLAETILQQAGVSLLHRR